MRVILCFVLSICVNTTWAQKNILYDLDSYKLVDFYRKRLIVNPDLIIIGKSDPLDFQGDTSRFDVNVGLGVDYRNTFNNRTIQRTNYASSTLNLGDIYSLRVNIGNEVRRFDKEGTFLLTGFEFDGYAAKDPTLRLTLYPNEQNYASISGKLGIGAGRLEFINQAWMAIQMLQTLSDNGELLEELEEKDITEFANLLGVLLNERYFDFRLRTLRVIESVVEHLSEKGLIDSNSIRAALLVQDIYGYEARVDRMSGKRTEISLNSNARTDYRNDVFVGKKLKPRFIFNGELRRGIYKNYDVAWMANWSFGAQIIHDTKSSFGEFFNENRTQFSSFFDYTLNYLPSVRDNFSANFRIRPFMDIQVASSPIRYSELELFASGYVSYNHFISPRTQVRFRASILYNDREVWKGLYQPRITGDFSFNMYHDIF